MRFHTLKNWMLKNIDMRKRLQTVCLWFLISLMVETRKHSLTFAAELSGLDRAQFCKFLRNSRKVTAHTLETLSKKQAGMFAGMLKRITGLPWKVVIIVDSTIQGRSSLKSENVGRHNHGKGFVIGHQWTNIILVVCGVIIPLPPIPLYSRNYCRKHGIEYLTEHDLVIGYLSGLDLAEYVGPHDSADVVVLADSGYDDKRIQNTIIGRGWDFVIALKCSRGVKSDAKYAKTRKSPPWDGIAEFFKKQRMLAWETVSILADSQKKRKEFRVRHTLAWIRGVGRILVVCSEFRKRRKGRKRKFIACSNHKATPEQILRGYGIRRRIETFHKHVKMNLGFEDVAAKHFSSVESHVYLVYCAYILLHADPPGVPKDAKSLCEKQQYVEGVLENRKAASDLQRLTQIGGLERYRDELKSLPEDGEFHKPLSGKYARV